MGLPADILPYKRPGSPGSFVRWPVRDVAIFLGLFISYRAIIQTYRSINEKI